MRALKSVVIGMAVLIVLGMALLVYGLARPGWRPFADAGNGKAENEARPAAFGDLRLPLPAGCSIADMTVAGQRLFVRTGPEGACARVYVIDAAGGSILGTVGTTP